MAGSNVYDYVIVGSGAAGAVIANRLSAGNGRVLVLEAGGGDDDPGIHDVTGFTALWGSEIDWKLMTTAQPGMAGRELMINQGRVRGGSTSINAMMYVRGHPINFDMWNALGADGWSYRDLLPLFVRLEDYEGGASEYHGVGGEIRIRDCPDDVMRSPHFLEGAVELGYDGPDWDYNAARQENGASLLQFHIRDDGARASASTAFLDPVRDREGLDVILGATATRIVVEGGRAVGVEYLHEGEIRRVDAAREVIVSAGALASPKLLMLSGIGDEAQLGRHGIEVVADLPGVGQNLQDHVQLPVIYRSKLDMGMTSLLTGNTLFVRTRSGSEAAPTDLQLNFTPAIPAPLAPALPDFGGPVSIFLPILVQPFSRGELTLRSDDPLDPPIIDPRYLDRRADFDALVAALELIREIAGTAAFAELGGEELAPGPGDPEGFIRSQSSTLWHPAGTARMGHDRMAVVDPQLRVHGVEGLRVADASIMPTVTSGNTVAACFAIGEKAAEMILQEHEQRSQTS